MWLRKHRSGWRSALCVTSVLSFQTPRILSVLDSATKSTSVDPFYCVILSSRLSFCIRDCKYILVGVEQNSQWWTVEEHGRASAGAATKKKIWLAWTHTEKVIQWTAPQGRRGRRWPRNTWKRHLEKEMWWRAFASRIILVSSFLLFCTRIIEVAYMPLVMKLGT